MPNYILFVTVDCKDAHDNIREFSSKDFSIAEEKDKLFCEHCTETSLLNFHSDVLGNFLSRSGKELWWVAVKISATKPDCYRKIFVAQTITFQIEWFCHKTRQMRKSIANRKNTSQPVIYFD